MRAGSLRPDPNRSDNNIALGLGALVLCLGAAVWGWKQYSAPAESMRPAPVYLQIERIEAHMSDGSMLAFKFGLELRDREDHKALAPYAPAFKQMVESMANQFTHEELNAPDSMTDMNSNIRATVNNYLVRAGMPQRVQNVYFEDWLLMM